MQNLSRALTPIAVIAVFLLPIQALAQWSAKAEAGVVASRGNSDSDSANAKIQIEREFVRWKHALGLRGLYASDDEVATGQRWEARGQTDYKFHDRGFSFVSARYEEDRFSGFEYQTTYGAGLGWRFFDDPITKLIAQLGVGYKTTQTSDAFAEDGVTFVPGGRDEEIVAQSQVEFEHSLTETTKVLDKVLIEYGDDNTFVQNDISLQVKIMSSLALALGYSVRYNTDPPPGFTTTDRLTTINLVYELN
jgi:putative salt-induced outer membrane protein